MLSAHPCDLATRTLAPTTNVDQAIAACAALKEPFENLRRAMGVTADATPEAVVAGIAAATAQLDHLGKMRAALGIAADAAPASAIAACTALKAGSVGAPDPAKYVLIATVEQLQTQVAALTPAHNDRRVTEVVDAALESGRLLPAMKDWAMSLGKSDFTALTAYIDKAQPIAALTATQTGGRQPAAADNELGLSADEIAVCTASGSLRGGSGQGFDPRPQPGPVSAIGSTTTQAGHPRRCMLR